MSAIPTTVDRRYALTAILLVALGLRIGAAFGLQHLLDHRWHRQFLIEGDAEGYWILGQKLAAGEDYSIHTPPRYVLRMPGFPALLAIPITIFGPHLLAARLFLAGLGTLACWLVARLGKLMFNERIGLLAAGVAAISPTLIVFSVVILSETAFAVMLLWSLCAGHRLYLTLSNPDSPSSQLICRSIWTGVAITAGVLVRPAWILAAPILAVLLILIHLPRTRALLAGGLIMLTMILLLLPWGLRNKRVTGHFTVTTFWMGASLYDGLNPDATGESDMRFFDRDRLWETMSEYEIDRHYRDAAKEFAFQHPIRVVKLAFRKALRYWSPWPNAPQFGQTWIKLFVAAFFIPILLLALWGGQQLIMRTAMSPFASSGHLQSAIWAMGILAGPILYFAVIHMVFVSSLRYRLPGEYPLLVLSAFGFEQLRWNWKSRLR